MNLTKLEVAQRQVATAIRLYFEDSDPVSTHTLAMAALEIIDRLLKAKGLTSMTAGLLNVVKPQYRKMVADKLNDPRNYFKHASSQRADPPLQDFSDERNLFAILDCAEGLRLLAADIPEAQVFRSWFMFVEPRLLLNPVTDARALAVFGNIAGEPRSKQKSVGRDAVHFALTGRLPQVA